MKKISFKESIKNIGSYVLGLAIFAGMIILPVILLFGIAKVSAILYPIFVFLASVSILIFFILVLPLSLIRPLRYAMAATSMILSMICGATIWMFSFLTIWYFVGFWALFLLFVFQVVSPIAVIVLLINGMWQGAVQILIGLFITYGMRFFGIWLEEKHLKSQYEVDYYTPQEPISNNLPKYCAKCGKTYDNSWRVCQQCREELLDNQSYAPEVL